MIGLVSAWRRGGALDGALPPLFVITSAFPYFWLALLAIWLFSIKLGWFPESGGYEVTTTVGWNWTFVTDAVNHSILPALTIIVTAIGGWILTMRNNMITVLTEDYVRMARAKGLKPWRIMWTYAGRNAILPNLVGFAMSLGFVVGGAILVEFVFNYPGVGWMFLQSVENQDYALMQALFLMITVTVLLAILAADVATADPRPAHAGARVTLPSVADSVEPAGATVGSGPPDEATRGGASAPTSGARSLRNKKALVGLALLPFFLVARDFPGQIAPDDPRAKIYPPRARAVERTTCSGRPPTARTSSRSSSSGRASRS